MKRLKSFSWENHPKNLDLEEIQDPFLVLYYYYEPDGPNEYLDNLEAWQDSVISYGSYHTGSLGTGEDLLYLYQAVIKLAEALYVLNDWVEIGRCFPKISQKQLVVEKREFRWFPKKLTTKESLEPYDVIKKIFKKIELQRLRDYLWEFLRCGLSQGTCDDIFDFEEVTFVFKQIEKLLSVAYLLACRDRLDLPNE
jgi:hypothetical protein